MDIQILNNSTMSTNIDVSAKKISDKAKTSFMDIFSSATSNDTKNVQNLVTKEDTNKTKSIKSKDLVNDSSNNNLVQNDKTKNDKTDIKEVKAIDVSKDGNEFDGNEFKEKISIFTKDLKEDIKEILDIDDEKLEFAMAQLQIELIQLVNPDIAKELVLTVNDSDTLSDVLVNEDLANDMSEMMDYFQSGIIDDSLEMPLKEMSSIVDEAVNRLYIKNAKEELNASNVSNEILEEMQVSDMNIYDLENEIPLVDTITTNKTDSKTNDNTNEVKTDKTENDINFFDLELDGIESNETDNKDISKRQDDNTKEFKNDNTNTQKESQVDIELVNNNDTLTQKEPTSKKTIDLTSKTNDTFEQFVSNLDNNIKEVEEITQLENEVVYVKQLRDIVNQVTEKVKITINNDTNKLEMNLNPKHLGKMTLDITENQGIITTKIRVENEMAREALESGLQSLKESLEEKGIKVNAIEISVESTAVDVNSRQNGGNFGQNKENEFAKKKGKKLNLDKMDLELDTPSLEDEQVMIDGVLEQVSSVSYTV